MLKNILKFPCLAFATLALAISSQAYQLGGSIGYWIDSEEAFQTIHFSNNLVTKDDLHHGWRAEIGFSQSSNSQVSSTTKIRIMPVTLNYLLTTEPANKVSGYFGVGAGTAAISVRGRYYTQSANDSDWVLALQAFAGFRYHMSEATSINLGARYLNLANTTLFNVKVTDLDDYGVELGFGLDF